MSDEVSQAACEELNPLFQTINEVLGTWNSEKNLQFPVLLGMIAVKLNWSEKQLRENDALVRWYVRRHPDWKVIRGAFGGIMRASEFEKKEAVKTAKDLAKKQVAAAIAAKTAAATPAITSTTDIVADPMEDDLS